MALDDFSIDDNDPLLQFLPKSFGKQKQEEQHSAMRLAKTRRVEKPDGEQVKVATKTITDEETSMEAFLPVSHQVSLSHHTKAVSALALDAPGVRIASGGYDYDVNLWDFGGMNSSFKPFKSLQAAGSYPVRQVEWSLTGEFLLVVPSSAQAKIFDRNGNQKVEFVRGDPYLRDMKNTNGHTAELTSGSFHPTDKSLVMTSSADSTVRMWDISTSKQKSIIVLKSKDRGAKSKVTHSKWSRDGSFLVCTCLDGALHVYPGKGPFNRAISTLENAFPKGNETSCVAFANDNRQFVTRNNDTVKLWDARKLRQPLASRGNLPSRHPETNVLYSPDDRFILTGDANGNLNMLEQATLEIVRSVHLADSEVIRTIWHEKINQILTSHADGSIRVSYDADVSVRGAKMAVTRAPKVVERIADKDAPIYNPDEDDRIQDDDKELARKKRSALRKQYKPEIPLVGQGRGGRVGSSANEHLTRFDKDTMREEDPREALLKYDKVAKEDPIWFGIYKTTQPDDKRQWNNDEEEKK